MQNKKILFTIAPIIALIIMLISVAIVYGYKMYAGRNKAYMTIGSNVITQAEFDYYYNSYYKMYVSNFSAFFDYMGVDSEKDLENQEYENGKTFKQLFDECTVDQIKQIYALYNAGLSDNFEHNSEADYEEYISSVNEALKNSSNSIDEYFRTYYGIYATPELIKKYMIMGFYANAYYEHLVENTSDEEAYIYTENLKNKLEVKYL